jgi:hypothetical protein
VAIHVGQELEAVGSHVELKLFSLQAELHVSFLAGEDGMDEGFV